VTQETATTWDATTSCTERSSDTQNKLKQNRQNNTERLASHQDLPISLILQRLLLNLRITPNNFKEIN
jgi:hypothetical protein